MSTAKPGLLNKRSVVLPSAVGRLSCWSQRLCIVNYKTVVLLIYLLSFWPQHLTEAMVTPQLGQNDEESTEKPTFVGPASFYLQLYPRSNARVLTPDDGAEEVPWSRVEQELEDLSSNEPAEAAMYDPLRFFAGEVNKHERVRKFHVDTISDTKLSFPKEGELEDPDSMEEEKVPTSIEEMDSLPQNTTIYDQNIVGSELTTSSFGCQDYDDPLCSPPDRPTPDAYVLAKKQTSQNLEEQYVKEKFKHRILSQIKHLDLASPRTSPTENISAWDALPLVIQKHLKNRVDAANKQIDNPAVEGEDRETFLVVHPDRYRLRHYPSTSFVVKIVDDIQPDSVNKALIHFEHSRDLPVGALLELLEIIPSVNFSSFSNDGSREASAYEQPRRGTFKVIKPRMAGNKVSNNLSVATISLDVTSQLVNWLKHRKTMKYTGPMIRHILLVCLACQPNVELVDPKKVVLEISYRQGLRRGRRSLLGRNNMCQGVEHRFGCCTQPLSIKFDEIGGKGWIIHPQIFHPNYCRGACMAVDMKSPHNEILNVLHRRNVSQMANIDPEVLRSCCHPTRRTSMSVVYLDVNKELKMRTWHNLIVLGCGCS